MNILQKATIAELNWKANLSDMTDYKPFTTFFYDFTIAELVSGISGVRDTFNRVIKSWGKNYKYMTELVMVMNHKIWAHYGRGEGDPRANMPMARLYDELWRKAEDTFFKSFNEDETAKEYYYRITD